MNKIIQKKLVEEKNKLHFKNILTSFKSGDILLIKRIGLINYKKRKQTIVGICIEKKNKGLNTSFKLRYIDSNIIVDQIFPLYSPFILEIKLINRLKKLNFRSKLYYLTYHKLFDIKKLKKLI